MKLAGLDTWVASMLKCLEEKKKSGGHRQKMYTDIFTIHVSKVGNQLVGQVRMFV